MCTLSDTYRKFRNSAFTNRAFSKAIIFSSLNTSNLDQGLFVQRFLNERYCGYAGRLHPRELLHVLVFLDTFLSNDPLHLCSLPAIPDQFCSVSCAFCFWFLILGILFVFFHFSFLWFACAFRTKMLFTTVLVVHSTWWWCHVLAGTSAFADM